MSDTYSNITVHNLGPLFNKELIYNKFGGVVKEIYDFDIVFDSETEDEIMMAVDQELMNQISTRPIDLKSDLESQLQS